MHKSRCRNLDDLLNFTNGTLPEDEAEQVAMHLDECAKCCDTISTLSFAGRTFADCQQAFDAQLSFSGEPEYRDVEVALRKMEFGDKRPRFTESSRLPVGTVVGPYKLEEWIGQGGMGIVYKALHSRLKKHVALKLLPSVQQRDGEISRRFEREMEATGALSHPNIVRGMDAGSTDGHLYLAMDYVDGQTLKQLLLSNGCFAVSDACEVIRQTALGLAHVHANGIIHRDIKPSNLMLTRDESGAPVVKILDLGLARFEHDESSPGDVTQPGQILGTLEYLAPEQADDSQHSDHLVDMYSLGATLYELLSGEPPVSSDQYRTPLKMLAAIANVRPAAISDRADVAEDLGRLVDQMLSRHPVDRPSSALDVAETLAPYAQGSNLLRLLELSVSGDEAIEESGVTDDPKGNAWLGESRVDELQSKSQKRRPVTAKALCLLFPLFFAALATVLWLKTDGGYIRIVADPDVEVTVEILKDDVVLESVEITSSSDAIWYRAGEYEIRFPADAESQMVVRNGKFTLKNRQREVVMIERIADAEVAKIKKHPNIQPVAAAPAERHSQASPTTESPLRVTISPVENADLKFLRWFWANCRGAIAIQLPEGRRDLRHINNRPLPKFDIEVGREEAATLPPRKLVVVGFTLSIRQVTDEFVEAIPLESIDHLEHVLFDNQRALTARTYEYLLRVRPDLEGLSDLGHDADLLAPVIRQFRNLKSFSFHSDGDRWGREFRDHKNLEVIHTRGSGIGASGINKLALLPGLSELVLEDEDYDSSWLDSIVTMKNLTRLSLPMRPDQSVAANELKRFGQLRKLTHLALGAEATRESVRDLRQDLPSCDVSFFDQGELTTYPPEILTAEFSETQARKYQEVWAHSLGLPTEKTITLFDDVTMTFQLIPPGEFWMGSSDEERKLFTTQSESYDDGWSLSHIRAEGPKHLVRISKPFYLSRFELTRSQWACVTGSDHTNRVYHKGDPSRMPVVDVSWTEVREMLVSLNERSGFRFSLPSEAQWEYACRAGTSTPFYFGTLESIKNQFWYFGNAKRKEQPVGTSQPNSWGLYDMHGNVHEWVQGNATTRYADLEHAIDPPEQGNDTRLAKLRVLRGGSAWDPPTACRSALRGRRPPNYKFGTLGLRLAMDIPEAESHVEPTDK